MTSVLVATECRFELNPDGEYFALGAFGYSLISRYLDEFDEVIVAGRVASAVREAPAGLKASGPNVRFLDLPEMRGVRGIVTDWIRAANAINRELARRPFIVLRVPGVVGTLVGTVAKVCNLPFGVEVVGDPADSFSPRASKVPGRSLVRALAVGTMKRQCSNAVAAAYVTQHALQLRYPPGGWHTHYSSVDLGPEAYANEVELARRFESFRRVRNPQDPWRIVHVGGLDHLYKGTDTLLNAVAQIGRRDLHVTIVGDGKHRQELHSKASALGISGQVQFLGRVHPGIDVRRILDTADLFVLPSRQEGLPRAMIEAMARGLPCVGSSVGGIPELLSADAVVPPNDSAALANVLTELLSHPDQLVFNARLCFDRASS
jgi:glycosyltransferase involved in cell wall biosynthesis